VSRRPLGGRASQGCRAPRASASRVSLPAPGGARRRAMGAGADASLAIFLAGVVLGALVGRCVSAARAAAGTPLARPRAAAAAPLRRLAPRAAPPAGSAWERLALGLVALAKRRFRWHREGLSLRQIKERGQDAAPSASAGAPRRRQARRAAWSAPRAEGAVARAGVLLGRVARLGLWGRRRVPGPDGPGRCGGAIPLDCRAGPAVATAAATAGVEVGTQLSPG